MGEARQIINRAISAIAQSDSEDEFTNILNVTRRSFRPTRRGRKTDSIFKKKTFLLRRSNSDYFPIKSECDFLTNSGLGYANRRPEFKIHWQKEEIERYICELYPQIPLQLVGFRLAKVDRKKKLIQYNLESGQDLSTFKEWLGASQIIILPCRDLPEATTIHNSNSNRSTRNHSQQNRLSLRRTQEVSSGRQSSDREEVPEVYRNQHTDDGPENLHVANYFVNNVVDLTALYPDENIISEDYFNDQGILLDEVLEITLNRDNVLEYMLNLYEDCTVVFKKLKVTFEGEVGDDFGGLTKELFTIFWEKCQSVYFHGENVCVPFLHLHKKRDNLENFTTIGRILTHMILLTRTIPNKIARTAYLLLGNVDAKVPPEILKEDYLYFITPSERNLILKAESSFDNLEDFEKDLLLDFFQTQNFFDLPKKDRFEDQLMTIAENNLCSQTIEFIRIMRNGIPTMCEEFWNNLNIEKLQKILATQAPTANKLIKKLKIDKEHLNAKETATLYYLKTYLRSIDNKALMKFLLFVTGSEQMPSDIKVSFTNLSGMSRRPIVHTCSNLLELSPSYLDYEDFATELKSILASEFSYHYTQI